MAIRISALCSFLVYGAFLQAAVVNDVGGGRVPSSGPAKTRSAAVAPTHTALADRPGHPNAPHVHADDVWIGHNSGPNDPKYHLDQAWRNGRFAGGFGKGHLFPLDGIAPDRFWFNGFNFMIAASDKSYGNDWFWDSDQVAVYEDPDHVGWYLVYNVRLGTYVHAMYQGVANGKLSLPDAPARATFETVCSTCHSLRTTPPRTKDAWMAVVSAMAARGASATDQQFKDIADYLAKYFGAVNVNQAPSNDIADVLELPAQTAAAIVRYRTDNGDFSDLEKLKKVPGVDATVIEERKSRITFK